MAPKKRVRFKTRDGWVSFAKKKRKSKKRSKLVSSKAARFEVWSIHDGGDRQVRRWKGSSEAAGETFARSWALERGMLVDLVRKEGKKEIYLRSFGG